jgi:hypothetical protein
MNEKIVDLSISLLVIAITLCIGWFLIDVQQLQMGEVLFRGCNETTIKDGCYTTDSDNYMIYCKSTFNSTANISESNCERVVMI